MKSNYWVEKRLISYNPENPWEAPIFEEHILSRKEFNSKLKRRITGGIAGLALSLSLIGAGHYLNKHWNADDYNLKKSLVETTYFAASMAWFIGAGKTINYFRHKNDTHDMARAFENLDKLVDVYLKEGTLKKTNNSQNSQMSGDQN